MMIALEVVAGFVVTSGLVTVLAVLAAFELGRLVSRDEDQRQVDVTGDGGSPFRRAA